MRRDLFIKTFLALCVGCSLSGCNKSSSKNQETPSASFQTSTSSPSQNPQATLVVFEDLKDSDQKDTKTKEEKKQAIKEESLKDGKKTFEKSIDSVKKENTKQQQVLAKAKKHANQEKNPTNPTNSAVSSNGKDEFPELNVDGKIEQIVKNKNLSNDEKLGEFDMLLIDVQDAMYRISDELVELDNKMESMRKKRINQQDSDYQKRLDEATRRYQEASEKLQRGSLGFFEEMGSSKAVSILKYSLDHSFDLQQDGFNPVTTIGRVQDATDLNCMGVAIRQLYAVNEIRLDDPYSSGVNKQPLQVTDENMAAAQVYANYAHYFPFTHMSNDVYAAPGTYGDCLFWSNLPIDGAGPDSFYQEKDSVEEYLASHPDWQSMDVRELCNDMRRYATVGHYLLMVNPFDHPDYRYDTCGYGINAVSNGVAESLTLGYSSDGNVGTRYSVSAYMDRFTRYGLRVRQEVQDAYQAKKKIEEETLGQSQQEYQRLQARRDYLISQGERCNQVVDKIFQAGLPIATAS